MQLSGRDYKRIVIKIGASLLYSEGKFDTSTALKRRSVSTLSGVEWVDFDLIDDIASQISYLAKDKKEIVLVSSGAIACGMSALRLENRPKELSYLQAAAAMGQPELMHIWRRALKEKALNCAQVLLTWEDFDDRKRYLNAKNTLLTLLRLGSVPVVNENDTVSTDEIKFGDNDRLSALVSNLIAADILIILSDVDGLLMKDKKTVIKVVDEITPQIKALACPTGKKVCVGGMITKIEAAKIAIDSGIPCVIANGRRGDIISSVIKEPSEYGTLFIPKKNYLGAKKRWIAFGTKSKGRVIVDDGAKKALLNKKSLLSVGVTGVEGDFEIGDIVSIIDKQGNEFARGKVGLSNRQLDKVKGGRYDKEVMHCDNIVIL